jgi:hypothetical protein
VTPEGFPLAYEVLPGNTADNSTLRDFLKKIEARNVGTLPIREIISRTALLIFAVYQVAGAKLRMMRVTGDD